MHVPGISDINQQNNITEIIITISVIIGITITSAFMIILPIYTLL
jgi:hypothetical protein